MVITKFSMNTTSITNSNLICTANIRNHNVTVHSNLAIPNLQLLGNYQRYADVANIKQSSESPVFLIVYTLWSGISLQPELLDWVMLEIFTVKNSFGNIAHIAFAEDLYIINKYVSTWMRSSIEMRRFTGR